MTPRNILKKSTPKDDPIKNFKKDIFECINNIRMNPQEFAGIVASFVENIEEGSKNSKPYLEIDGVADNKIYLVKGKSAFISCIEMLNSLHPLPPLTYKDELELELPEDPESWTKREVLTERLEDKASQLTGKYESFGFQYIQGVLDPVLATVLQIVDDSTFHGQRRNNILSHNFKYMGVSHSKRVKDQFCSYITFGY